MSMDWHSPEHTNTATSAIDYETDTVIQTSLRQQLGKDVTLLTVAHRLQTIMDADKIVSTVCADR
jgi:ABC-type multidrug transport system fused ATPase/permease subunit